MTNASRIVAAPPLRNVPPFQSRLPISRSEGPSMTPLSKTSASIRVAWLASTRNVPASTTARAALPLSLTIAAPSSRVKMPPSKYTAASPSVARRSNIPCPEPPARKCRSPDSTWTTPSFSNCTPSTALLKRTSIAPFASLTSVPAPGTTSLPSSRNRLLFTKEFKCSSVPTLLKTPLFTTSTASVRSAPIAVTLPPVSFRN